MRQGMTAFALAKRMIGQYEWQVEIRSVNHRYLDITPRLSDTWRHLEPVIRERLQQQLQRGKIDLWISVAYHPENIQPILNHDLLQAWLRTLTEAGGNSIPKPDWQTLIALPGILCDQQSQAQAQDEDILSLIDEALTNLMRIRRSEGESMTAVIHERLASIQLIVGEVRAYYPTVKVTIEKNLRQRLDELALNIDTQRFEQELVFLLSKADIDEELDRLNYHIQEVKKTLKQPGSVGRRLDFLMQELNREANTLGSKAADSMLSGSSVNLKVLIEQIREQVQNIE